LQGITKKVIVIGGGIAGCSTAYALAKRGLIVTLIEQHQAIAQEASGNPVGMLYPKFNSGISLLSTIASQGFAFTLALLKQLPANSEIFNICGQIQLAFNTREQENQAKLLNNTHQNQIIQQLSATEASEKANIALNVGGLYLPESGWVKPNVFCQALIHSDLITTMTSTQAIKIKKQRTHWDVFLNKEQTLEADIVVLCNANSIHQFEPCRNIPITPVRGQVNFFKVNALSERIKPIICSDHYLSPSIDGFHAIGTSYGPNDLNPALSIQDTSTNLLALKKMSPALFSSIDNATVTGRVAWRSATKDYIPLAGQLLDEQVLRSSPPRYNDNPRDLPWLEGLYVNAGHGSKGMITAPMCGELIANQITGEPFIIDATIASKLNPSRFLLKEMGLKKMALSLY
jgi:tRNA 5-methylaminomethyl-2-thiouridine biosynthesis bifunctional protein